MYTGRNFRTKKQLTEALKAGDVVTYYQAGGIFPTPMHPDGGTVYLEGPHYPEPHRWYATAKVKNGLVLSAK